MKMLISPFESLKNSYQNALASQHQHSFKISNSGHKTPYLEMQKTYEHILSENEIQSIKYKIKNLNNSIEASQFKEKQIENIIELSAQLRVVFTKNSSSISLTPSENAKEEVRGILRQLDKLLNQKFNNMLPFASGQERATLDLVNFSHDLQENYSYYKGINIKDNSDVCANHPSIEKLIRSCHLFLESDLSKGIKDDNFKSGFDLCEETNQKDLQMILISTGNNTKNLKSDLNIIEEQEKFYQSHLEEYSLDNTLSFLVKHEEQKAIADISSSLLLNYLRQLSEISKMD